MLQMNSATDLENSVDTKIKVEAMTVELEQTKSQLAIFQKECDDYLVIIVQQKRDTEEQEKAVTARSEKVQRKRQSAQL